MIPITPGQLLAAHPTHNTSDVFDRSVVLITEHSSLGTMGLVLNKSYPITQNEIIAQKGFDTTGIEDRPISRGGPVNTHALILVHDDGWFSSNTKRIAQGVAMSSDLFMIEKISTGNTPRRMRWVAGMSGWQAGQLQAEIQGTGAWQNRPQWLPIPYQRNLIFKTQGESLWRKTIEIHAKHTVESFF